MGFIGLFTLEFAGKCPISASAGVGLFIFGLILGVIVFAFFSWLEGA